VSDWLQRVSFLAPDWKDAIDIVIVAAIIYRILRMMWGTRAIQMLLGLFSLVAIYGVASVLDLRLIEYLLRTLFQYGIIAALVVFQPELRSALTRLGQNRLFRVFTRLERNEVAEEISEAAEELSRNRTGAIIAIEREVGLGEYAETGTRLQARVSAALLQNVFTPYSLLHDGAAIIRGDEIVAAGAILPLTQAAVADRSLGTRHRAALGLSDETDAIVVVISEETGAISVAHRGRLRRGITPHDLQDLLAGGTDLI
jgi:diadenylate cyclase